MPTRISFILLLLALTASLVNLTPSKDDEEIVLSPKANVPKIRTKRGVFWDFFQKIVTTKNLVVDQYNDTKNTLNEAYNLFNDLFSDPAPPKPTNQPGVLATTTSSTDEEGEVTTESYRISRYELGRILGRNFRGLQRLQKIEFQDALNQSFYNIKEYKAEADKQFANSLALEKKNLLKRLKG